MYAPGTARKSGGPDLREQGAECEHVRPVLGQSPDPVALL